MATLDADRIKKLKRGELIGLIATFFCGAVLIYFIVMFTLAWIWGSGLMRLITWSTAPALMAVGIIVAAFCNIKYGGGIEKLINGYVVDVFVENAALLHPERNSLTFYIEILSDSAEVTVNNYKEKIVFDFSAFKKLSVFRKMTVLRVISNRLSASFIKLYERGAGFKSVEYREKDGAKNKTGKLIPIIVDGKPDKIALRNYRKNR